MFFFLIQTLFFVISHFLPPHRPMQTALRKVYPYYFTFTTFTKGRWVGEKILDVFAREFRAHPAEEYERCINAGTLTVNYEKVPTDYRLKHNDLLANVVHRFVSIASYGRKTFFVFILFLVFMLCVCKQCWFWFTLSLVQKKMHDKNIGLLDWRWKSCRYRCAKSGWLCV